MLLTASVAFLNCPWGGFPSYFSRCSWCVSSLLLPYLLFSMVLLRLNSFNIFSFEILRYFSRLCTSTCTKSSSPIITLHSSHLCNYSLSKSALGWCVPEPHTLSSAFLFSNLVLQVPSMSDYYYYYYCYSALINNSDQAIWWMVWCGFSSINPQKLILITF